MGFSLSKLVSAPFSLVTKPFKALGDALSPEMGTTQTTNEPWSAQQPYLKNLFSYAQNLYGGAAQSPETLSAIQKMRERAMGGNNLTAQSQAQFGKTIAGDYLDPSSNPYLASTVQQALDPVQARVNSTFGVGGGNNFGSSAHADTLTKQLANTALPFYMQNYQTERDRQLSAAGAAPGMAQADYADIDRLMQAGQMQTQAPWDQLARYQGAVSGNYGGVTTQPYWEPNPYMNLLGAGIAGYGIMKGMK
jgi:hypothetical protein